MATKKKISRVKSLSTGRPPHAKPARAAIVSSKATRTLIRAHHNLEKLKAKAIAQGDDVKVSVLTTQIEAHGGLKRYQQASLQGQANDRGGDSSKILMEWLEPISVELKTLLDRGTPARLLEVGALSVTNACSRSGSFHIERIDLNSQAEGITQQDFMERPLPRTGDEKFDVISLSLVLNYVPDPVSRGHMLMRTVEFLQNAKATSAEIAMLPCLFLVLPAPCLLNSRYMDENTLEGIMRSLGYSLLEKKISNKLIYYLWRLSTELSKAVFKKEELRSGKTRNNFAIVIK